MKKLSLQLFGIFALGSMVALTGCDNDDENGSGGTNSPNIKMQSGAGLISGDETVNPEDTVKFSWIAQQADNPLSEFAVTRDGQPIDDYPVELDPTVNSFYRDTLTHVVPEAEGNYNYTFQIGDSEGFDASASLVLTVQTPGNPIDTNSGSLNAANTNDSSVLAFYDVNGDAEYAFGDANNDGVVQSSIDFGFYVGGGNAVLAATSNFPSEQYDLSSWVQNETVLRTTDLTPGEFDGIGYDQAVISGATGASETRLNVEQDDVVGFITDQGDHGLLKVTNLNLTGDNSTIEFVVKIQR